jgi:hypothetical protein
MWQQHLGFNHVELDHYSRGKTHEQRDAVDLQGGGGEGQAHDQTLAYFMRVRRYRHVRAGEIAVLAQRFGGLKCDVRQLQRGRAV